jgi:hypothetical protein
VKQNEPTHGYSGPLKVSYGGAYTNVGQQFLDIAREYDSERGQTDDGNDLYNCNTYNVSSVILFNILWTLTMTTEMAKVRSLSVMVGAALFISHM